MDIEIRKWLNKKGFNTTANVYLEMNESEWDAYDDDGNKTGEKHLHIDGSIDISDCYKKITLQLGAGDKPTARNNLYKIDTLIDTLLEARGYIEERMDRLPAKRG